MTDQPKDQPKAKPDKPDKPDKPKPDPRPEPPDIDKGKKFASR